jgi:hypothetical protein
VTGATSPSREPAMATIRRMADNAAEVYGPDDQRAIALAAALDALTELDEVRAVACAWRHHPSTPPFIEDRLSAILDRRSPIISQETLG